MTTEPILARKNSPYTAEKAVSQRSERKEIQAPSNYPALVAVRRRREIIIYRPNKEFIGKPPKRSKITRFSNRSGSRLRRAIDNSFCDYKVMITLTYPSVFPSDGKVVKKQLKSFFERLRRHGYLDHNHLVWWLEFQERGAPHIHIVATGYIGRRVIAKAWSEVTDGNIKACSRTERLRKPSRAGSYAAKYACKKDQKVLPDEFTDVGRWWGRVGCGPEQETLPEWYTSHLRRRGRKPALMKVPKVSAGTNKVNVISARMVARERTTRVHEVVFDHGIAYYGPESRLNAIWDALMHE